MVSIFDVDRIFLQERMLLVKKLVTLLLLCTLFVTVFGISASAAYVTDGTRLYEAGDVNDDGTVDVFDLVEASIGKGNTVAADLDGDGTIGAYDCALIRAMILGIDNSLWT
jgi:hypothetical protein